MSDHVSHTLLERADRLGVLGSTLCAAHCALMPMLLAAAPMLGLQLAGLHFDQGFLLFATLLGTGSIGLGCRRHQRYSPWLPLASGVALVGLGAFSDEQGQAIFHALATATGGLLIALAHWMNLRFSHAARQRSAGECSNCQ